ncbi:bifunctional DNA primase/polymerase [Desulfothermobacter acidiphilus]|uniref:bifunctional DNA primase/polymerase n=1 Tax=Desulfothermobacter acidiphilus TaxID=1938353 RepID=UPI003F8867A3
MPEFALRYLGLGWSVIPLHTPDPATGACSCRLGRECGKNAGKHTRLSSWKEFQERLPTGEEVREWWERWPDANVGLVTGRLSGVVVLDLDGPAAVEAVREKGGFPETAVVKTSRGWHYYFRYPDGVERVPSRAGVLPGVDVRADGGVAVLPPSLHVSGVRYSWAKGRSPWDVPLAELPGWLLELLLREAEAGKGEEKEHKLDVSRVLAGVPEGQRDTTIFRYACRLRARGLDWKEAKALVLAAAAACRPPFPEKEALKCLKSAWKYPPGTARRLAEDRARLPGRVAVPEDWDQELLVVTADWELAKQAYAAGKAVVVAYPDLSLPPAAAELLRRAKGVEVLAEEDGKTRLEWALRPLLLVKSAPPVVDREFLPEREESREEEQEQEAERELLVCLAQEESRLLSSFPELPEEVARLQAGLDGKLRVAQALEEKRRAVEEYLAALRELVQGQAELRGSGPGSVLPDSPSGPEGAGDDWDSFAPPLTEEEMAELRRSLTADPFEALRG